MQLILNEIEYTYPGAADPAVLGVSVTLPQGWTGLVGDNGCGKTTLARIACGLIKPDAGSVSPRLLSAYCPQSVLVRPEGLEDFAAAYDRDALRLRQNLGIDDGWPWRYGELSGGQRKLVQLACTLWARPDLLVVDEPTNHVDAPTREAIRAALSSFRGVGILISHDRALLDALCSQCLFMRPRETILRPGSYSEGASQEALEHETSSHKRDRAVRDRKRLATEAQRLRQRAALADSRRSARKLGKHDSDARAKIHRAILTGQDGKVPALSARMEGRLARAEAIVGSIVVEKTYEGDVWADAMPCKRRVLMHLAAQALPLKDGRLLRIPKLYLGNTDHIALVGRNGTGKTTLVGALLESFPRDIGLTYIPQELDRCQEDEVLARVASRSPTDRGFVLSIVARLNSDPSRALEGGTSSPGELRKLMLALGILDRMPVIVMDEPTNHLDLRSAEALGKMLKGFPGALLLVSHDERLVASTTTTRWEIMEVDEGELRLRVR